MIFRSLLCAAAVFVPLGVLANVVVEAVPHARGIAFAPALRYALITPATAVAAVAGAFFYEAIEPRVDRAAVVFGATVFGCAAAVVLAMLVFGSRGLAAAGAPAVVAVAAGLALLVPWAVARPPGVVGTVGIALGVAVLAAGVVAARASERAAPPGRGGMAFDVPRALFDVDHRFADLPNGARVHYVDEGSGPTLLFLHGNPAWSFQWRDLVVGLRGRFRCVAIDYPGFGLSPAPAGYGFTAREQSHVVEEFIDRLGLSDVTLVMQDWGGPIGLGLAGRRPELVRAVVLGNTWAWPTSTQEVRGKFSLIAGGPVGEFVQMNFNAFASLALSHGVVRKLPEGVSEMYLRPFRPFGGRGVAAFYPGQITAASDYMSEVEAGLGRIADRRALIFWGLRDAGFPRADLERFERAFPRHETIELPDASHFFFEDAAAQMVDAIAAFGSS